MTVVIALLVGALLVPGSALAVSGSSSSGNAAAGQYAHDPVKAAQLPFTGYALIALVPIALIMLSTGLVIRRRARGTGI